MSLLSQRCTSSWVILGIGCLFLSQGAEAVVTATGRLTEEPANGAPWDNVLSVNGLSLGSGVYLGGGWVLTAEHVFDDVTTPWVTYNGVNYYADMETSVHISNPTTSPPNPAGKSAEADLTLFRLSEELPLPTINLGAVSPGSAVTMIGFGANEQSWGTNTVISAPNFNYYTNSDGNDTIAFVTHYDSSIANEGQGEAGDSGGGVFFLDGSDWKLGGIMIGISTSGSNQYTIHVHLAQYKAEIEEIIANAGPIPEPSVIMVSMLSLLGLSRRRRVS